MKLHHPYPMSRCEAELYWEFERQRLRAHIATLPSFSFEKTKFEEDEAFYATFPEAHQAAVNYWISEQFPFAPWAEHQVAQYESSIDPTYNMQIELCAPSPMTAPTPTAAFTSYTLGGALTAPSTPPRKVSKVSAVPKAPTPPMPVVHYDYSGSVNGHDVHSSPASVLTAEPTLFNDQEHFCVNQEAFTAIDRPIALMPTPHEDDDILRTLELVVPARRPGKHVQKAQVHLSPRKRIPKDLYPSTSLTSSRSTIDTPPSSPPSSQSPVTPTVIPSNASAVQLLFTGNWEEDAIATAEYINMIVNVGKKPSVSIPVPKLPLLPTEQHVDANLIRRRHHRHSHRQRLHPYSPSPSRPHSHSHSHSPSRECSKSASPPNKRPNMLRDENGKPIIACHFCRGRKIACGPPPKGSSDPTCNQCARRGLDCQYPTINRRGMRKKKSVVNAHDVVLSEASSSPSSNITPRVAAHELRKISKGVAMSDYSDESGSDWDGDN